MLETARVIACGRGIRNVERLVQAYGGQISGWTKRSTTPLGKSGDRYEYHWYQHHGLGRFEVKRLDLD